MDNRIDSNVFTVELLGQDLSKDSKAPGRYIARYDHFPSLKDALLHLLSLDVAHFDEYYSSDTRSKHHYQQASIVHGAAQTPVLDLYRVHFSDSLDGIPAPGLYLRLMESPKVIEEVSGIPLAELSIEDQGVPFIMLARIRFDQQYELVRDPALLHFQERLRAGQIAELYGPADWRFQVRALSFHYQGDIRDRVAHYIGRPSSEVRTEERYCFSDLRQAFDQLLLLDHYSMAPPIREQMGLGYQTQTLQLADAHNHPMVSVHFVHEIKAENRLNENGLYLSFHTPITAFEKSAHLDLSGLRLYPEQQTYHQIMSLTADGQRLVCLDGFRSILGEVAKTSPKNMATINGYLEQVPFLLRIEWAQMPEATGAVYRAPPTEVRPFVSQYQALVALKDVSEDLFYPEQPTVPGQGIFIKHAGVYDGHDGKPIWTKFLSAAFDPNLPKGVITRLHDQKISFETLPMTLQLFSYMVGKESLQFMVCKPPQGPTGVETKQQPTEHKEDKNLRKGPSM